MDQIKLLLSLQLSWLCYEKKPLTGNGRCAVASGRQKRKRTASNKTDEEKSQTNTKKLKEPKDELRCPTGYQGEFSSDETEEEILKDKGP
ncbi:hypothetical protein SRHO_G00268650 [Serrasalmus rhombeus]